MVNGISAPLRSGPDSVLLSMLSEVVIIGRFDAVELGYAFVFAMLLLLPLLPRLLPMLAMLTLLKRSDRLVRNSNVELENVG